MGQSSRIHKNWFTWFTKPAFHLDSKFDNYRCLTFEVPPFNFRSLKKIWCNFKLKIVEVQCLYELIDLDLTIGIYFFKSIYWFIDDVICDFSSRKGTIKGPTTFLALPLLAVWFIPFIQPASRDYDSIFTNTHEDPWDWSTTIEIP